MSTEEGTHTLPDGLKAYSKTWKTNGPPRAILAFFHGFSDHCNTNYDLFPTLASSGIEVRAFDQRGWGRTFNGLKDRGNTGSTAVVLDDMHSFLTSIAPEAEAQGIPLFLAGHSMGGGQVLNYILHPDSPYRRAGSQPKLAGLLVLSPLIGLDPASRPWTITIMAGRVVARILPRQQRHCPLNTSHVSRDKQVVADFRADDLCHEMGTFGGLAGMLDRGLWLEGLSKKQLEGVDFLPIWFAHGDQDRITSYPATKRVAELLAEKGDVTFASYEGGYHKLQADLPETRAQFSRDAANWILAKAEGSQAKL
ncbi:uncharacterized protein N7469_010688 [Penicillium citrinum]|uniref:Serine aminopeptidase S33 domain-containing protein n=2 Tax=Penicillium TaxID=5073 RepID=A0A9W9NL23_PENCI|nr:uncharacterized protein N7469_010688 [Penicillium citrinum]KAJ5221801.1 hypothetical protein N7469_010688 [Penicillium citrinum]KAJ5596769.1 hypothetical protein N7450_003227 [Penicillium hetheringtonii]